MRIIPHLSLRGRTVLRRAYPRAEWEELISRISAENEMLYVSDEDGIERNKPQLDLAREICDEVPTMYEAGVRHGQNVIDVIIAGAEKAVVGTATLADLDELRTAFKLSENIILKADYRDGILGSDPSLGGRAFLDLSRDVLDIGIGEMVVPLPLASEAARAKEEHGFVLGVFAPKAEQSRMADLGFDYMVTEDLGSIDDDE
ncbi:MAG: HisA/HisF-related TIM barrel protein [Candidatus Thermoplasmatota archaeon]